jgi:molybdate transport system regulatory protein
MGRYSGLMLRIVGSDYPAMGPGKAELISLIKDTGSISAAARRLGMSYRRAWQLVEALNNSFVEPVVITAVGGKRGGGAQVTSFGLAMVGEYRRMEHKASRAIMKDLQRFSRRLRKPVKLPRLTD